MGLGDKFKSIAKQAQEAVVEHKDQLHDAVDTAGVVADRKTRGRHSAKIAKFSRKAGDAIDKLGSENEPGSGSRAGAGPGAGPGSEAGEGPGAGPGSGPGETRSSDPPRAG